MGGEGSGRFSERSTAWDFQEFALALMARLERARCDPSVLRDTQWYEEHKARLQALSERMRFLSLKRSAEAP